MHSNRLIAIAPTRSLTRRAVLGKTAVAAVAAVGVGATRKADAQAAGSRARAMQDTATRDGASWVDRVLVTIPAAGDVVLGEERYVNGALRWVTYNGTSGGCPPRRSRNPARRRGFGTLTTRRIALRSPAVVRRAAGPPPGHVAQPAGCATRSPGVKRGLFATGRCRGGRGAPRGLTRRRQGVSWRRS